MPRDVFTTGQVAKICRAAPHTISKWVDSGRIEGAYRLPDSQDRHIPRSSLIRFMKEIGVPTDDVDGLLRFVVLRPHGNDAFDRVLQEDLKLNYDCHTPDIVTTVDEAKAILDQKHADCLLADLVIGTTSLRQIAEWVNARGNGTIMFVTKCRDHNNPAQPSDIQPLGYHDLITRPFNPVDLVERVKKELAAKK